MPWIDFRSGFALVGSVVVLVGSIVTRRNSMRPENPEGQGGSTVPEGPNQPEPMNPSEFLSGLKGTIFAWKPFKFKKRTPPTASS
jgi:hypothetical protein